MVSLKLLCSSTAVDELIDVWLSVRGYKYPARHLGQGGPTGPRNSLGRPAWADRPGEGPIRRTREEGSEWEPIKILLEGDENSNKTNAAFNTRLRLTTQVGQAHVATGVSLDLGTNTHDLPTREHSGTPNLESTDPHRSDQ
jgi:hypothetical protein